MDKLQSQLDSGEPDVAPAAAAAGKELRHEAGEYRHLRKIMLMALGAWSLASLGAIATFFFDTLWIRWVACVLATLLGGVAWLLALSYRVCQAEMRSKRESSRLLAKD